MHELGDPQEKIKVMHVAGTSGKTSTCYYIAKMLQLSGRKVGLTVSPHVDEVNERVQINCEPLDEIEFLKLFDEFTQLPAMKNKNITYFGMLVAFAYWVFAKKKVDYAVIEVGMGGRLDATNVIKNKNKICVITDIGLDHTQFLGKDLVSIAKEKSGIIHTNNETFVANQDSEVLEVFKSVATKNNSNLHVLPKAEINKAPKTLPPFQKRNWSLAKLAFEFVAKRDNLETKNALSKSAETNIPARMEEFKIGDKTVITDGSHNAQKISALCEGIKQQHGGNDVAVMVSFASGKDSTLKESLSSLKEISNTLIVTEFGGQQDLIRKPISPKKIAEIAKKVGFKNIKVNEDPEIAFDQLLKTSESIKLVTGSFFLLNHVRPNIRRIIS